MNVEVTWQKYYWFFSSSYY